MAENSAIEWCDHTFNPWEGCQKVGPGCDHCYAETRNARYGGGTAPNWGPGAPRRRTSAANWRKPLAWQRGAVAFAAEHGRRQRVFCASLADVFDNAVDLSWRADLFALIDATPDLDWLLLTKRIGNVQPMLWETMGRDACPRNVWLGATVVNQAEADRDVPKLLAAPAQVRFLSMEPLLGPVDLTRCRVGTGVGEGEWAGKTVHLNINALRGAPSIGWRGIDWIIVGGESGPGARPMHPDWARALRDHCVAAGVPFLFKQWGEWAPGAMPDAVQSIDHLQCLDSQGRWWALSRNEREETWVLGPAAQFWKPVGFVPSSFAAMERVGKKAAGRLLDGVQHDGVPA